jgi:glycyl-tRNA synthetase beta chain
MPRFVLEIGTEEIPPRYFPVALPQLKADGEAMLARARLSFREVRVYGTPRRLALIAEEMAAVQAPAVREERGPAARVAFDAEGKPSKAAIGFARRHGLAPQDLVTKQTDQGDYVFAVIQEPEAPAKDALAPLLPALITGIPFPKAMRWGRGALRFGRPIRWLLALVDDQAVEFELDGIKSGRLTRGHPVLADGMFEVSSAGDYERALEQRSVTVNQAERESSIRQWLDLMAAKVKARVVDGGLLQETTFLLEYAIAGLGRFDPSVLDLPRPVLVEEMQHVQSYFPLEDDRGNLLAQFIAFRDGGREHLETVVGGWESVLRAKLTDAKYFYEHDLKRSLVDRVDDLKGVVFQEKLGTMYDKVERIHAIAENLAAQLELGPERTAWLTRAALLCKADLTTRMVAELPQLQGVMGAIYAAHSGEPEEIVEAIRDHYEPHPSERSDVDSEGPEAPATTIGTLLAIADKTDTITSCFAAGIRPSGSADPLALRRDGTYLVRCWTTGRFADEALNRRFPLLKVRDLAGIVLERLAAQGADLASSPDEVSDGVVNFLAQRLEYRLLEQGVRQDLIRAAFAVGVDPVRMAYERGHALRRLSGRPGFVPTVIACTRVINISKGVEGGEVDSGLFQEKAEHDLWIAYRSVLATTGGSDAEKVMAIAPTSHVFDALFGEIEAFLVEPINRYFDEVLVMHENEKIRRNRLAMCWQINQLFRRLADFTLIVQV